MSTDYVGMLIANMQEQLKALTSRVEALESAAPMDEDDQPGTYMDGTPIR
jgi:uncharacterized coiled-coil protein SlyX